MNYINYIIKQYQINYKYPPDGVRQCTRCLYDDNTSGIYFDDYGVCNYCHLYDDMDNRYKQINIEDVIEKIKRAGHKNKYDAVVGISGGCDSSFLLNLTCKYDLRVLAVNYDNGYNTDIAGENIKRILAHNQVDYYTYRVDSYEMAELYRAFLRAGVAEIDAPSDIGFISTLYGAARQFNIRYILDGHSFRTEGVAPLGWCYFDGRYIESIYKEYSSTKCIPKNKNSIFYKYPNLTLPDFINYLLVDKIKRERLLYYYDYNKNEAKENLKNIGWQDYGGHHHENLMTYFNHVFIFPIRFGIDQRVNGYSALIRSGQMTRNEGMELMSRPVDINPKIISRIMKGLFDDEYEIIRIIHNVKRTYKHFDTYKKQFELFKPLFWFMMKRGYVPESFYKKYCQRKL